MEEGGGAERRNKANDLQGRIDQRKVERLLKMDLKRFRESLQQSFYREERNIRTFSEK